MKKSLLLAVLTLCASAAHADEFTRVRPVQFGVGVGAGTTGVSVDAVLGLRSAIQIRGGYTFVPKRNITFDAGVYNEANNFINIWNMANPSNPIPAIDDQTTVQLTPTPDAPYLLLDLYPSKFFHLTFGAYFGREDVVSLTNAEDGSLHHIAAANSFISAYNNLYPDAPIPPIGLQVGNYILTPDAAGNISAEARVRRIRPYFGIGFGRAVPRKSRFGCSLDLGVQYWGKPSYFCNGLELEAGDFNAKSWERAASTSPVYPVVTFRLSGRIF